MNIFFKVKVSVMTNTYETVDYERFYSTYEIAKAKVEEDVRTTFGVRDAEINFIDISFCEDVEKTVSVGCNVDNFFSQATGDKIISLSFYIKQVHFSD